MFVLVICGEENKEEEQQLKCYGRNAENADYCHESVHWVNSVLKVKVRVPASGPSV